MSDHKSIERMTGLLAVVGIFGVVPAMLGLMFVTSQLGAASIPIWLGVSGAAWLISKGAIGEAIAMRLRGEIPGGGLDETALAELEDLRARVAELEERQDFSERLLAQKSESARPEAPGR
ncbi:MAG TPA: hypothetical protein VG940_08495 [Gemmatimonadales bacterium]|nr:hypothetical protein [Gemmatimonadales bacterium]